MMREVALSDDPEYLKRYPHQLSGGQQQRVGPRDGVRQPSSSHRPRRADHRPRRHDAVDGAHDRARARRAHDVAALYVTHDLAVVAAVAARVAVMYAGRIVELGPADKLFESSAHPYTRRLVGAIPRLTGGRSLVGIPGHAPSPGKRPGGCAFAPRCALRIDECEAQVPDMLAVAPDHESRCIKALEVVDYQQAEYGDPVALPPSADECGPQPRERRGLLRLHRGAPLDQHDTRAGRGPGRRRGVGLRQDDDGPVDRRSPPRLDRQRSGSATPSWRSPPGLAASTYAARSSTSSRTPTAR